MQIRFRYIDRHFIRVNQFAVFFNSLLTYVNILVSDQRSLIKLRKRSGPNVQHILPGINEIANSMKSEIFGQY